MAKQNTPSPVDCACVIHGTGYDWIYVERLYNMLSRNLPNGIRFHVYTEHDRSVPAHMTKHVLTNWPEISGLRRAWWYKLQLFNSEHHQGNLLYFDLDTVILRDISWIPQLPAEYLWGIRDFKHLQRPGYSTLNSSVMWWNVDRMSWVWDQFNTTNVVNTTRQYPGDQDYLNAVLGHNRIRYLEDSQIQSWRWQCLDGGYNFNTRRHKIPGQGTQIPGSTSVLVFHGKPKPHEINDKVVQDLWR
jgi:hypothetical protein